MSKSEPLAPLDGLSQTELFVLTALGGISSMSGGYAIYQLQQDVERMGLTPIGAGLGLRRLTAKDLVRCIPSKNGMPELAMLTDSGWDWIDSHERLFAIKSELPEVQTRKSSDEV